MHLGNTMIGKLFEHNVTLITFFNENEVFEKLEKHCVGREKDNKKIKVFFKGKFNMERHEFQLLQIFDYGPHNQIRPEIKGIIANHEEHLTVNLKISLSREIEVLLDFAVILNLGLLSILTFIPFPESIPKLYFFVGLPAAMLVTFFMAKIFFNSKSSECIVLIERIINARKSNS